MKQQRQEQELEPMAAAAAAIAAAAQAGRYAGGGMRTVGRRVGRTRLGLGARAAAAESRRRAFLALRVMLRGLEFPPEPPARRRPATYVAVGVVAGATGAAVVAALRRAADNGQRERLAVRVRGLADAMRRTATPAVPEPAPATPENTSAVPQRA